MKINQAGIELIKASEGVRLTAYRDVVGVWTIGYGHTSDAGPPKVVSGLTITKEEAEEILKRDLSQYEEAVSKAVTVPLNENQFAACVSLCYNIGPANFRRSSIVRRLNEGSFMAAANAFRLWNKAGGRVLPGLKVRRENERTLFLKEPAHV